MLYLIFAWGLLGLASWVIGLTILNGLRISCFIRQGDRFVMAIWLGLVLLSNILLALALGTALSSSVGIGVGIVTLLLVGCWRAELRQTLRALSLSQWASLLAVTLVIAYYTSQRVTWIDAGLYHFGATRWLAEFGAVPGLALLLDNFGFTSAWFALTALLSPATIAPRVSAVTNSFVLFIMIVAGLIALHRCLNRQAQVSDWFMAVSLTLILPILFLTTFMSAILVSSSPDIPVIFLTIMVAWSVLTLMNHNLSNIDNIKDHLGDASLIPVILAAGALAIKLTALPLLPVALLFHWSRQFFNIKRLLVGVAVALLILLPNIAMGAVVSGCPFYPVSTLCLDLPWTLTDAKASNAAELIRGWDRWFGSLPEESNPVLWRIWQWLKFARLNIVMLLLLLASVIIAPKTLKTARKLKVMGVPWLFSLGILGMIFILLRAPMIRFGLGYFVVPTAVAIAVFMCRPSIHVSLSRWQSEQAMRLLPIAVWGAVGVLFFSQRAMLSERLLLPPAMPSAKTVLRQSHDVTYAFPTSERRLCWTAPLPCSRGIDNVQLRNPDKGIAAGFTRASKSEPRD
ncbi:MAG: hypothetical protein AAGE59_01370 [Cyanobacteria bacterium P01_F01_bin.86]